MPQGSVSQAASDAFSRQDNELVSRFDAATKAKEAECTRLSDQNWLSDFAAGFPNYQPQPTVRPDDENGFCSQVAPVYSPDYERCGAPFEPGSLVVLSYLLIRGASQGFRPKGNDLSCDLCFTSSEHLVIAFSRCPTSFAIFRNSKDYLGFRSISAERLQLATSSFF